MRQLELFPKYEYQIGKKKIRLIETFSGIGCQALALEYLGVDFEHYKTVEFDPYPNKIYNAIHGTNFPVTDIRNIHGSDLNICDKDKYCYVMTYSFPCFTGDTLVLTNNGFKEIKDIKINDYVLTHDNSYQKVSAAMKTGTKNIYKIKSMPFDELNCTENHLFYVREMYRTYPRLANGKRTSIRNFKEPAWKECKDLTKNNYVGIAINQNSIIPEWNGIDVKYSGKNRIQHLGKLTPLMGNKEFWWLMGYYVGDGWQRSQTGIELCGNASKMGKLKNHLKNLPLNYCIHEERTCYRCSISIREIGEFVKVFGKYAYGKKIPKEVLDLPIDLAKSFLDGYIASDGYKKNNKIKISSVSKELIYGIGQLVAKVYHRPFSIYKTIRPKKVIIEGRVCNQKDTYTIAWKTTTNKQDKAFYENGYIWCPINKIINTKENKDVYDITVENNHSFTANGVIVHNCTDISLAGKQEGMAKGSGTRSSLLWEVTRILHELKDESKDKLPDILLMENVTQVHSSKNIEHFQNLIEELHSLGYSNYWQDCNAKNFGIAQNRDRTFMMSILGDYDYTFPEEFPLTRVMVDFLDKKVEEKFYINNEKSESLILNLKERGVLPE